MSAKFRRYFRIESARLPGWDYSLQGMYFITICTSLRKPYFGRVCNRRMYLSEIGTIAHDIWLLIPQQFNYIKLDSFIVQPDHLHGILIIEKTVTKPCYPEIPEEPKKIHGGVTGFNNPMNKNNISRVIRWYKGRCSYEIRKKRPDFKWQSRFHDRIVRSSFERFILRLYIDWHPPSKS